jgi:hypothetical protein
MKIINLKNSKNEILASTEFVLNLNKYEVKSQFKTGYGAKMRTLRGMTKKCIVYANSYKNALLLAKQACDIKEEGSLCAGYVVSICKKKILKNYN